MADRGFSTAVKSLLDALKVPRLPVLIEIPSLSLKITNYATSLTFDGVVYQGSKNGTHKFTLAMEGLGENIDFQAPSAVIKIGCLDGYFQAMSYQDQLRDVEIIAQIVYIDTNHVVTALPWSTTFRGDADTANANEVVVRLASIDAVQGSEIPKRTTQETGCEFLFMGPDCGYRWFVGRDTKLRTCDHGYDTSNGCKEHWGDVRDPATNQLVPQPKPYSGYIGGIDHRLVLAR